MRKWAKMPGFLYKYPLNTPFQCPGDRWFKYFSMSQIPYIVDGDSTLKYLNLSPNTLSFIEPGFPFYKYPLSATNTPLYLQDQP